MAKTKNQKQETVENYLEKLNAATALFIITPTKITPNEANALRRKLSENDASFNVVKNSLFKIALKKVKKELKGTELSGENAVVFAQGQESESAKTLYEFLEEAKKGEIRGGFLNDEYLTKEEVEELAKLPSREILIATTVQTLAAPLSSFVRVLNANISSLVNVLKNISENKSD